MSVIERPYCTVDEIPLANGDLRYLEVRPTGEITGDPVAVVTGFTASPEMYLHFAQEIARLGRVALITDLFGRLPGENPETPLENRLTHVSMAVEDSAKKYHWEGIEMAGHSFGGATQARAVVTSPLPLKKLTFINSAGFTDMGKPFPGAALVIGDFVVHEALPHYLQLQLLEMQQQLGHLPKAEMLSKLIQRPLKFGQALIHRAHLKETLQDRKHEFKLLRELQQYVPPYIEMAIELGIPCPVLVSPHDTLVDPRETRRVVELISGAVIEDIHPRATHLSIYHPRHARHIAHMTVEETPELKAA